MKSVVAIVGRPNVGKSTLLISLSAQGAQLLTIPPVLRETEFTAIANG